jgi:hypothetical protein
MLNRVSATKITKIRNQQSISFNKNHGWYFLCILQSK